MCQRNNIKGSPVERSPFFFVSTMSKLELKHLKMQLTLLKEMPGDWMLFLLHPLCFSDDSSWEHMLPFVSYDARHGGVGTIRY